MMQMLSAGGMPALTDGIRVSDTNNPRGYYEWEKIKTLLDDPGCIVQAEGKAVKVVSALLRAIPPGYEYRVIFMNRILEEVIASQREMITMLGASGPKIQPDNMTAAFKTHLSQVSAWLEARPEIRLCRVDHSRVLKSPAEEAARVREFLEFPLDLEAMVRQVDPSLYRQRSATLPSPRPV